MMISNSSPSRRHLQRDDEAAEIRKHVPNTSARQTPQESWEVSAAVPVGNDNGIIELAAAVLAQCRPPSIGDDGVGAVQLVESQVIGCARPSHGAGAPG